MGGDRALLLSRGMRTRCGCGCFVAVGHGPRPVGARLPKTQLAMYAQYKGGGRIYTEPKYTADLRDDSRAARRGAGTSRRVLWSEAIDGSLFTAWARRTRWPAGATSASARRGCRANANTSAAGGWSASTVARALISDVRQTLGRPRCHGEQRRDPQCCRDLRALRPRCHTSYRRSTPGPTRSRSRPCAGRTRRSTRAGRRAPCCSFVPARGRLAGGARVEEVGERRLLAPAGAAARAAGGELADPRRVEPSNAGASRSTCHAFSKSGCITQKSGSFAAAPVPITPNCPGALSTLRYSRRSGAPTAPSLTPRKRIGMPAARDVRQPLEPARALERELEQERCPSRRSTPRGRTCRRSAA